MIKHYAAPVGRIRIIESQIAIGQIAATAKAKDKETGVISPKQARIDVQDMASGRLIAQTWSNPSDGSYRVEGLVVGRKYKVTASDNNRIYRLVGADWLIAKAS